MTHHEERHDEWSFSYRCTKQAFLFLTWVAIGVCIEIMGPCMEDLKGKKMRMDGGTTGLVVLVIHADGMPSFVTAIIGCDYKAITRSMSGRDAGFFLGALGGGVAFDRGGYRNSQLVMAISTFAMALFTVSPDLATALLEMVVGHSTCLLCYRVTGGAAPGPFGILAVVTFLGPRDR